MLLALIVGLFAMLLAVFCICGCSYYDLVVLQSLCVIVVWGLYMGIIGQFVCVLLLSLVLGLFVMQDVWTLVRLLCVFVLGGF